MTDTSATYLETEPTALLFNDDMISMVSCPEKLSAAFVSSLDNDIDMLITKQPFILLELEKTSYIDSGGLAWLIKLSKSTSKAGGGLYLKGIKPSLIRFLKLNRVWDLFQDRIIRNRCELKDIIRIKTNNPGFYPVFETEEQYTIIRLFGRLEAKEMNSDCHSTILKYIHGNHCIFDLNNLSFIDSTGLALFIKIFKKSSTSQNQCVLYGLNNDIRQMFTVTKLINLFTVAADFPSALRKIKKAK